METGDPAAQLEARLALRNPNGPWKHGSTYLYIDDPVNEQTVFNGGFPDRFEFLNAGISRDAATGELVWDLVQEAASYYITSTIIMTIVMKLLPRWATHWNLLSR